MKCVAAALSFAAAISGTAGARTGSPVEAVVKLLEDLQGKIVNDGKAEQQTYDKFACWCEKTTDRKATAIIEGQQQLRLLGQQILKLKGTEATLTSEITELNQEIKTNLAVQAEATALRQQQNGDYQAKSTEAKSTLASLEKAAQAIIAGTAGSLLQTNSARAAVTNLLDVLRPTAVVKPEHVALLGEFASGRAQYNPQSGTVVAILKDMYATVSGDLEAATGVEASSNRHYEIFIQEKTKELQVLRDTLARKTDEKAQAELLLAETVQNYDDTEAQRKADILFFDETKSSCIAKHDEWVARDALRAEELDGVKKTLEILTSDEARAAFAKAAQPGIAFLQTGSSESMTASVAGAYAALRAKATSTHSLRLAALAVRVHQTKVGHFDGVIKAIDDMMATLKAEDKADVAKRDQCKSEYQNVASTIGKVTWLIQKNGAKIHKLEDLIGLQNKERDATIAEIADTEQQIAALKHQRAEEHAAFEQAKADDEAAVALLTKALEAFEAYSKNHGISFAQAGPDFEVSADQAPDADFSGADKHKHQSKGISMFINKIIEDLNAEIRSAVKAEAASQADFEKQLAAAEALKEDLLVKKSNLEESIAKREEEKSDEHASLRGNQADLKDEQDYLAKIKPDCDWIIGAFQERASRRTAELDGLRAAKSHLAGAAKGAALLQQSAQSQASFDDSVLPRLSFRGLRQ